MSDYISTELVARLNILVMERLEDGSLKQQGTVPSWCEHFYPINLGSESDSPDKKFLFLENFLIDAERYWQEIDAEPLKSGLWTETDLNGREYQFEASAIRIKDHNLLLIELLQVAYEEKHLLIQKARESELKYNHYVKEIQEKEVLLHCILHDLAGELTTINCSFALLALENLTIKGREYLEVGKQQAENQGVLMREILNAFSAEFDVEAGSQDPSQAPDIQECAIAVMRTLMPLFSLNQVRLQFTVETDLINWQVVGERSRLERVLFNLVENALRYSPSDTTVTIRLSEDKNFLIAAVEDQGPGVSQAMAGRLFQRFSQGADKSGKAGLGLYFCRITVERWGGTVGYTPLAEGGTRFWFRLPKLMTAN